MCNRAKDGSLYWVDSIIAPLKMPMAASSATSPFDMTSLNASRPRSSWKPVFIEWTSHAKLLESACGYTTPKLASWIGTSGCVAYLAVA